MVLISVLSCQFSSSPSFSFSKHVLSIFSGSCDRITKLKSTISALNYQLCYSSVFLTESSSILVNKEFWILIGGQELCNTLSREWKKKKRRKKSRTRRRRRRKVKEPGRKERRTRGRGLWLVPAFRKSIFQLERRTNKLFQYNTTNAKKDVMADCYGCTKEGHLAGCGHPRKTSWRWWC